MQQFRETVFGYRNGVLVPFPSPTVTVYLRGTDTLATIYSANDHTSKANPFTGSALGEVSFYALDGRYDVAVTKAGFATVVLSDVILFDGTALPQPEIETDDPRWWYLSTRAAKLDAAISYAISRFPGGGGKILESRPGNLLLTAPVLIGPGGDGITIGCVDPTSTRYKRGHNSGPLFRFYGSSTTPIANVGIKNFFVFGTGLGTVDNSPHDIEFDHAVGVGVDGLASGSDAGTLALLGAVNVTMDRIKLAATAASPAGIAMMRLASSTVKPAAYCGDVHLKSGWEIQCGEGLAVVSRADFAMKIEACDGFTVTGGHAVNAKQANVYAVQNSGGNPIYNLNYNETLLDHSKGYAMVLAGSGFIGPVTFSGRCSSIGAGDPSIAGIAVTCASKVSLDCSLEGYKGDGLLVNHANAEVEYRPREVVNNDSDNNTGHGAYFQACAKASVQGGRIGSPNHDYNIRIGAACAVANIVGVDARTSQNPSILVEAPSGTDNRIISIQGCLVNSIQDLSTTTKKNNFATDNTFV